MTLTDPALQILVDRVHAANAAGAQLCIRGGGTKDFYGEPAQGEPLDVRVLEGISRYEPTELVLTARAGTSLAAIESAMRARGQMLAFMGGRARSGGVVARWDAIDVAPDAGMLSRVGYDGCRILDVDGGTDPALERRYDAMIFLHLLEHLRDPEACLAVFARYLPANGVMIGGSPTMPRVVADAGYERRLARRARPYGHVSVISPERIEAFAEQAALRVAFMSGAFFMRRQGSALENSRLWLRLNLAFGGLFPSLGSEIYFALERDPSGRA